MPDNRVFAGDSGVLQDIGGDGASMTVPRNKQKIFKCISQFIQFRTGMCAKVSVQILTRTRFRRWADWFFEEYPHATVIEAGPFIVAVSVRSVPRDDPELVAALADVEAERGRKRAKKWSQ